MGKSTGCRDAHGGLTLTWDDSLQPKCAFLRRYINMLLPALRRIHSQSFSSACSLDHKLSAIKVAADMSLAVSAQSNNAWSRALLENGLRAAEVSNGMRKMQRKSSCSMSTLYKRDMSTLCKRQGERLSCSMSPIHKRDMSTLCRTEWSRSNVHTSGSAKSLLCANVLSQCTQHSASSSIYGCPLLNKPAAHQRTCKSRRIVSRSGQSSSYLRILRSSTRCARKCRRMKENFAANGEVVYNVSLSAPAIKKEQIQSLSELVPGGSTMDIPLLLEEAADYILTLQMQVEALQSLWRLVSG